jgi:hypothetical protein
MAEICKTCKGVKKVDCTACENYPCAFCEGTGHIPPHDPYKSEKCDRCDGRGYNCKKCENTGKMDCEDCDGDGTI